MFVIRYMMVAVALHGAVVAWGIGAQLSFWQIIGMVAAATLALQVVILVYIAWAVVRIRGPRRPNPDPHPYLVILPR